MEVPVDGTQDLRVDDVSLGTVGFVALTGLLTLAGFAALRRRSRSR